MRLKMQEKRLGYEWGNYYKESYEKLGNCKI